MRASPMIQLSLLQLYNKTCVQCSLRSDKWTMHVALAKVSIWELENQIESWNGGITRVVKIARHYLRVKAQRAL